MKTKKHRNRKVPNPVARGFPTGYEPSFKRSVILYAEQKSNQEARKRYGISEETIKRWRRLRKEIMEKAQQCIRRSQRHTMGHGSFSESAPPPAEKIEKEKSVEKEKISEDKVEKEGVKLDLDSMPLQQRLSQNHNEPAPPTQSQESVLQSQPISPTKLKVTRQGKPQPPAPRVPTPPPPAPPQVCLKWNSHHVNMQSAFPNLLTKEQYVDATLVSEGKTLKCHRMILSSCSPYFEEVLNGIGPLQHPVLFMKDIPFWILKALCDFMYAGEVHILQDKLQELLNVATSLKIKGLAGPTDTNQDVKPIIPEIKQEIDPTPPPNIPEQPLKEEKEEEPPPPPPPKPAKHETVKPSKHETVKPSKHEAVKPSKHEAVKPSKHEIVKPPKHEVAKPSKHEPVKLSKKKEDKKSKHASQMLKEKEKIVEEPPPKVPPKVAPKVVTKVVLPKASPAPRTTVKNVMRSVIKPVPKPSTSKTTHASRKSDTSRKSDKHKAETAVQKEKEKEKDKPPLKKDNINDPLDLLQPVYEEIAKEDLPQPPKSVSPGKLKERGNVQLKRSVNRKVKKRRYAEYAEDREESPPPMFQSRKGTRSRPHVKIPKFFHTHFDESAKETTDATIVREPHTDVNDPLIGVEVEEIKAEPVDVEENTIEMEENLVNFMVQDQEMVSHEGEEIIGNYDSPLVNIKREPKRNTPNIFKKVVDHQPIIMDIHTVAEPDVRLLNIKEENVQIVDIAKISTGAIIEPNSEETIIGTNSFDSIEPPQEKASEIIISNVQSMAELSEENRLRERDKDVLEDPPTTEVDSAVGLQDSEDMDTSTSSPMESYPSVGVRSLEALTSKPDELVHQEASEEVLPDLPPDPLATAVTQIVESRLEGEVHPAALPSSLENEIIAMDTDEIALRIKVENVTSEERSQNSDDLQNIEIEQCGTVISGSFGSLEAKLGTLGIESEGSEPSHSQDNNGVCGSSLGSLETKIGSFGISESQALPEVVACREASVNESPSVAENVDSSSVTGEVPVNEAVAIETAENNVEDIPVVIECPAEADAVVSEENTEFQKTVPENTLTAPLEVGSAPLGATSSPEISVATILSSANTNLPGSEPTEVLEAQNHEIQEPLETSSELKLDSHLEQNALAIEQTIRPPDVNSDSVATSTVTSSDISSEHLAQDLSHAAAVAKEVESVKTELVVVGQQSEEFRSAVSELSEEIEPKSSSTQNETTELSEKVSDSTGSEEKVEHAVALETQGTESSNIAEPLSESAANSKDSTENIEAELEQCLASTSDIALPKLPESRFRMTTKPLPFDDDEDFTKDIEFDNFASRNRPTNYLGDDFGTDFEMGEIDYMKKEEKAENEAKRGDDFESSDSLGGPVGMNDEMGSRDGESELKETLSGDVEMDETFNRENECEKLQIGETNETESGDYKIVEGEAESRFAEGRDYKIVEGEVESSPAEGEDNKTVEGEVENSPTEGEGSKTVKGEAESSPVEGGDYKIVEGEVESSPAECGGSKVAGGEAVVSLAEVTETSDAQRPQRDDEHERVESETVSNQNEIVPQAYEYSAPNIVQNNLDERLPNRLDDVARTEDSAEHRLHSSDELVTPNPPVNTGNLQEHHPTPEEEGRRMEESLLDATRTEVGTDHRLHSSDELVTSNTPVIADNFQELHPSPEEEQRMEESLLDGTRTEVATDHRLHSSDELVTPNAPVITENFQEHLPTPEEEVQRMEESLLDVTTTEVSTEHKLHSSDELLTPNTPVISENFQKHHPSPEEEEQRMEESLLDVTRTEVVPEHRLHSSDELVTPNTPVITDNFQEHHPSPEEEEQRMEESLLDVTTTEVGNEHRLHSNDELVTPNPPVITDNFQEHHPSPEEEEQRMEESLLADLDDDIVMKDATTSQEDDDGTEKTLEMIVNDLNESLGEMKK